MVEGVCLLRGLFVVCQLFSVNKTCSAMRVSACFLASARMFESLVFCGWCHIDVWGNAVESATVKA